MGSGSTSEPGAGIAYVGGEYVPISEAKISVLDWGFSRSDVTYDVVAVTGGAFFRLDDHLDRFEKAMAALRMDPGLSRDTMREVLHGCVARSGLRDAYVEMLCTRGIPPPGTRDPRGVTNAFTAYAIPYVSISGGRDPDEGLDAVIASTVERIRPSAVDPTVKNFHWGDLVRGLFEAYDRGAETVILTNGAGLVTEGPGFNVFAVVDGEVVTPRAGMLLGITRQTVFDICADLGLPCQESDLTADRLRAADEIFLTSTAGGIMPVTRLDGTDVGGGEPGPLSRAIHRTYWDWHAESRWLDRVDYSQGA